MLEDIIVPIGICVVTPVLIVFLVMWARRREIDRKSEMAIKAMECGLEVDPKLFAPKEKKKKTYKGMVFGMLRGGLVCTGLGIALITMELLKNFSVIAGKCNNDTLFGGLILMLIGIALVISWSVGKKHFALEIQNEEEQIRK